VRIAILTVSDGCFHGTRHDRSGEIVADWCSDRGHELVGRATVPDETQAIVPKLLRWVDDADVDVVITTGGTGFAPRDVTPEATRAVIEREAVGLAEALRRAGEAKTMHALLSRGVAGVRGGALIVNLPGSPAGVRDGLELLDRLAPHAVALARDQETEHRPGG
jgi:molybdenum cofactor synthesis domain-containing protein